MKIIHVCGWYFPDSLGGTETYVAAAASRLQVCGHEVLVAAPDPGRAERSYVFDGLPVYRYPIPAVPTRDEAQHVARARGAERFHEWLREQRPDVVHLHTFVTGVGPHEIRAARAAGARVFVTTHSASLGFVCQRGTLMRWGRRVCDGRVLPAKCAACELQHRGLPRPLADVMGRLPTSLSRLGRSLPGKPGTLLGMPDLIRRNQERHWQMLREVEAFVVLTDVARAVVIGNAWPGAPVVLNRLGIRGDATGGLRTAPSEKRRAPLTVAYVGRFDPIKGVHDLARAVRMLPAGTPVRVDLRGPVSNVRELTVVDELKAIVGPDAWVTFGSPLEPDAVPDYLRDVDLLCCPSRTLEGGPTVALEAMAVGTPVLASNLGGLAELLTDGVNGCLVPPNDPAALAQAIARIAADPAGTIDAWRCNLPPIRTMDDVVGDYLRIYAA